MPGSANSAACRFVVGICSPPAPLSVPQLLLDYAQEPFLKHDPASQRHHRVLEILLHWFQSVTSTSSERSFGSTVLMTNLFPERSTS
jgi:hypothetical protein